MNRVIFFLLLILSVFSISNAKSLVKVHLDQYGSLEQPYIDTTIANAIEDIEGKCLILPSIPLSLGDISIIGKRNFAIQGNKKYPIISKNIVFYNCSDFELKDMFVRGNKDNFATFYIKGDCSNFKVHDCLFDSEKGTDGHNQFYGIHVIADIHNPNASYENSPRGFRIYNNVVKNTRYDGILVHAHCSDFVIEKNTIIGAECIGIESEGRYGGSTNTTVHPCKNAIIRNNVMRDCGDWGILLMWTDSIKVYGNKSYNAVGSFLSIGCTNLIVKDNVLEGTKKGFELSNEFYKIENGINRNVLIEDNTIVGRPRASDRGVLDIRHSKDIIIKRNKIKSIYRENGAMVSVVSCKNVNVKQNKFETTDETELPFSIFLNNACDYETKRMVPELNLEHVNISNNEFRGMIESIETKKIELHNIEYKKNRYK